MHLSIKNRVRIIMERERKIVFGARVNVYVCVLRVVKYLSLKKKKRIEEIRISFKWPKDLFDILTKLT